MLRRLDLAINAIQKGSCALLIDDFSPKFIGYIVSLSDKILFEKVSEIQAITKSEVDIFIKPDTLKQNLRHNVKFINNPGVASYICPYSSLSNLLDFLPHYKYALISTCYNKFNDLASEVDLRKISTQYNYPPFFLSDIVKHLFPLVFLSETHSKHLGEIEYKQYLNSVDSSIYTVFSNRDFFSEEKNLDPIRVIIEQSQQTLELSAESLNHIDQINHVKSSSNSIFIHICRFREATNEENRIFFTIAKILSIYRIKRIMIFSQRTSFFYGTTILDIEVTDVKKY